MTLKFLHSDKVSLICFTRLSLHFPIIYFNTFDRFVIMQKDCVLCDIGTNVAYSRLYNLGDHQFSKGKQKPIYCLTDSVHFINNPLTLAYQGLCSVALSYAKRRHLWQQTLRNLVVFTDRIFEADKMLAGSYQSTQRHIPARR